MHHFCAEVCSAVRKSKQAYLFLCIFCHHIPIGSAAGKSMTSTP